MNFKNFASLGSSLEAFVLPETVVAVRHQESRGLF